MRLTYNGLEALVNEEETAALSTKWRADPLVCVSWVARYDLLMFIPASQLIIEVEKHE